MYRSLFVEQPRVLYARYELAALHPLTYTRTNYDIAQSHASNLNSTSVEQIRLINMQRALHGWHVSHDYDYVLAFDSTAV